MTARSELVGRVARDLSSRGPLILGDDESERLAIEKGGEVGLASNLVKALVAGIEGKIIVDGETIEIPARDAL